MVCLYISNVEFLGHTALPKLVDLEAELDEMGEFLLCMAQERAKKAGVEADTLVKRGDFIQALKEVLEDLPVTAVVLGSSPHGVGALPPAFIQKLGEELSRDNGVEFIVTHKGEIVKTYFQDEDED